MRNGVLLMGLAALAILLYTKGSISILVIMYSINVFLTFSMSQTGMIRYFVKNRNRIADWKKHLPVHIIGLVLCLTILLIAIYEKFMFGGWLTLVITFLLIVICYRIRNHYNTVRKGVRKLDEMLLEIPTEGTPNMDPPDKKKPTAVILVDGYNGFGVHLLLNTIRNFPRYYHNYIFASAAIVDTGSFKGAAEIDALKESTEESLKKYVDLARRFGLISDYRMEVGTEAVESASQLCQGIAKEFSRTTVFTGKLIFQKESLFQRLLHNETAYAIQRRLQWEGITTVVLSIRTSL